MNPLIYILPMCVAYALLRAYLHRKAKRKMWMIQMLILAGFMSCVWLYELWLLFSRNG